MTIKALGGCCSRSTANYENAVLAVKELGLNVVVEHISDVDEIMKLGVMATPGLVIDGKVVASGRPLTVSQIKDFIKKAHPEIK
jgi:small redox-active disulfide protein 2